MKLKCLPADFQVEELTAFTPDGGPFALYLLTKESVGTPEAIAAIGRRWRLARGRISFGGLKDTHARTRQFVTVERGPPRNLQLDRIQLEYLGQASRPYKPQEILGNRFHIVVRDLSAAELAVAQSALEAVQRDGLPNYFDDQRFGSLGQSGQFVAQAWCLGDYERALWLALADPQEDDPAGEREQKQLLRDRWGDWTACRAALARSPRRDIVSYLADQPQDFRGAWARVSVDLRGLYLAALQSFLWNRMLASLLRRELAAPALRDVPLKIGPVPFFLALTPDQRQRLSALQLPLPSARLHTPDEAVRPLIDESLQPVGLELRQVRVKYPRDSFFAKGDRPALTQPAALTHAVADDELYPQQHTLTLDFELPRGAYATILVKRLTVKPSQVLFGS